MADRYDAVVVGSGPNGLAAAITLAREGWAVLVLEAGELPGGGARSAELTLPGYVHDICSSVHPWAGTSPFFTEVADDLAKHGFELVHPEIPLAHPLDGRDAGVLRRSVDETAAGLGDDGPRWRRLLGPVVDHWDDVKGFILGPQPTLPRHPIRALQFALRALPPARSLAARTFSGDQARALFAGNSAHSIVAIERALTGAAGMVLTAICHAAGGPFVRGGSQALVDAMVSYLRSLGGEVECGQKVTALSDLPPARARLLDVNPRQLVAIAGDVLPPRFRRKMERYRAGAGVFKVDYALDGPVPWSDPNCARAGTVHVGGTLEEVAAAERDVWEGRNPERPFVLTAQATLCDDSRAPEGRHTYWAYCHVPNGSTVDMTDRIDAQIERFAPGFLDRVLARSSWGPADFEAHDANLAGGDIAGGSPAGLQMIFRPALTLRPYHTPIKGLYLCSASTPPGAGVHGQCGWHAAHAALRDLG